MFWARPGTRRGRGARPGHSVVHLQCYGRMDYIPARASALHSLAGHLNREVLCAFRDVGRVPRRGWGCDHRRHAG
jgi:hypothetical protein